MDRKQGSHGRQRLRKRQPAAGPDSVVASLLCPRADQAESVRHFYRRRFYRIISLTPSLPACTPHLPTNRTEHDTKVARAECSESARSTAQALLLYDDRAVHAGCAGPERTATRFRRPYPAPDDRNLGKMLQEGQSRREVEADRGSPCQRERRHRVGRAFSMIPT